MKHSNYFYFMLWNNIL